MLKINHGNRFESIVSVSYKDLPKDLVVGSRILVDDGLVEFLVEEIDDTEIHTLVSQNSAEQCVKKLIELANEHGGEDNITAIVMEGDKTDA